MTYLFTRTASKKLFTAPSAYITFVELSHRCWGGRDGDSRLATTTRTQQDVRLHQSGKQQTAHLFMPEVQDINPSKTGTKRYSRIGCTARWSTCPSIVKQHVVVYANSANGSYSQASRNRQPTVMIICRNSKLDTPQRFEHKSRIIILLVFCQGQKMVRLLPRPAKLPPQCGLNLWHKKLGSSPESDWISLRSGDITQSGEVKALKPSIAKCFSFSQLQDDSSPL